MNVKAWQLLMHKSAEEDCSEQQRHSTICCKKHVIKRTCFFSAVFVSSDCTQQHWGRGKCPSGHVAYINPSCVVFSHAVLPLIFSEAILEHLQMIKYHAGFYFSLSWTKSSKILTSISRLSPNNLIYSSCNQMFWEVLCTLNTIMAPFVFLFNVRLLRKTSYTFSHDYFLFLDTF